MTITPPSNGSPTARAFWLAVLAAVGLIAALVVGCGEVSEPPVTPTPTRTPRPPTPTPTPIPSPTPTPAWPVTAGCREGVPDETCGRFRLAVEEDPQHFTWSEEAASADVQLGPDALPNRRPFATLVYALAAPFYTLEDGVSAADLDATLAGEAAGPFAQRSLLVSANTSQALDLTPSAGSVQIVTATHVLTEAVQRGAWAVVPFDDLDPRWKVLRIDGTSPLDRGLDLDSYPLDASLYLGSEKRTDALDMLPAAATNRDEERMSVVMMTGVTALTRGTARTMDREGVLYPARDVYDWLTEPDITHTSNEVSFAEDCPTPSAQSRLVFCSDPSYFELVEYTEIDVLELTGNHLLDWGVSAMENSLRIYEEHGLPFFGGGWTLEEARQPLTLTHGVHTFGFVGCNAVGPSYAWATAERPGAASCDYDLMAAQVHSLREQGVIPIVTFQYLEVDRYAPTASQQADFRAMAEAGAAIVSGSQAHWPQGFDFHAGSFIHYGLGNLFFDQMQRLEYRQEFLDRHVFYDGRHISTELLTALLEDYARPRPMTPEERQALLEMTFSVSGWWSGAGTGAQ
jgi:poly-gamma-glutamate synthesis protein (capsule biosynthesis protein)